MKNSFFVSGLCLLTASQDIEAKDNKLDNMNILFIQADQHRYDCTGFSQKGLVKTPNIDKLASEGVVFTNSYSCIPTSCPARQSLISGKWPEQHKGLWNYDITLPVTPFDGPTWTEKLSEKEIKMGYVGKWHVSDRKSPKDFGFDDYVPEWSYNNWRKKNKLPDYVWQDSRWVMGGYDPVDNINLKVKNGIFVLIQVIRICHATPSVNFLQCMRRIKYVNGRIIEMICQINPISKDSRFIIGNWKIRTGRCGKDTCNVILPILLNWMMPWVWLLRL